MRIANPYYLVIVLAGLVSQACSDNSDDGSVAALSSVLQGDWYVVRTLDNDPDKMVGHDFWHFDVSGDRFTMGRSCGGATIAAGTIQGDGSLVFDTGTPGSSSNPLDNNMKLTDNTLVHRVMIEGAPKGETFTGHAVEPLLCELSRSGDGSISVGRQTPLYRVLPANLTRSSPAVSPSSANGASARKALAENGDTGNLLQHLKDSYGSLLPSGTPYTGPQPGTSPTSTSTPNADFLTTCTATPMTTQQMKNTFTAFSTDVGAIYPGALIQGLPYQSNQMIPVSLSRTPLTVVLTGPTLVTTAPSMSYVVNDPGSFANVQTAINSILNQGVQFGSADFSENGTYASTDLQLNLDMGAAGSYDGITAGGSFSLGGEYNRSTTVYAFNQTFYTVSVDTTALAHPLDAFTADATDPPDPVTGATQIGTGNPPLYVSSVSYGRQILIAVTSSYSEVDVKATLDAAFGPGGAGDPVNGHASIKNSDVFTNASITYMSRGGKDTFAQNWTAITGADGKKLFENVKTAMQAIKVEPFTTSTPAAMIGYSLKYLANRSPAGMLYATDYTETACSTARTANAHTFTFGFSTPPNYKVQVDLDGNKLWERTNPGGAHNWSNQQVPFAVGDTSNHTIRVRLWSAGGATGMGFGLRDNNNSVFAVGMLGYIPLWTGLVFDWSARINASSGVCKETQRTQGSLLVHYSYWEKNSCN